MSKDQKQEILTLIGDIFSNAKIEELDKMSKRQIVYMVGNKFNVLSAKDSEWIGIENQVLEIFDQLV